VLTPKDQDWVWPCVGAAGAPYAVAALVGFHARAGSGGFRPHTVNDFVRRATIAGRESGEVGILALGLAALGLPLALVTGDTGATDEAHVFAPRAEVVPVRRRRAGTVGFLAEREAPAVLRAAARRGAARATLSPLPPFPATLTIETFGAAVAQRVAREAPGALPRELPVPLRGAAATPTLRPEVTGSTVAWVAPDALTAFLSLVFVASACRGPGGDEAWAAVSAGFQATRQQRWAAAVAAFERALRANPEDVATHCRLGGAWLGQGQTARAHAAYLEGALRLDEIGDPAMRTVCLTGLGRTLERLGAPAPALVAWRRALALPDFRGSHVEAGAAVQRLEGAARR
jgi:hypothetical protein